MRVPMTTPHQSPGSPEGARRTRNTLRRVAAPLALGCLVLAACGDDDDESDVADPPAETDTATGGTEETLEPATDPEGTGDAEPATASVYELLSQESDLSTLLTAVDTVDLAETLGEGGPFTVFAPSNEAFETALDDLGTTLDDLVSEPDLLESVVTYHVVQGEELVSADLEDGMTVETVEGSEITIEVDGGVTVEGATVTDPDLQADNGVVHVIDAVLFPDGAEGTDATTGTTEG